MKTLFKLFLLLLSLSSFGQETTYVKDQIMENYMKSGFSTKNFIPNGETDKQNQRQGFWKDYEVKSDYTCIHTGLKPKQIFGRFLLYGEGIFKDGKREGKWIFYTIEDITFKKIIQKEVNYKNGILKGEFKYFFPNESVAMSGNLMNDELHGTIKSFHTDGKIYGIRFYDNGLKIGKHIYIYSNGKTELEHSFVNGVKDGPYIAYYPNGNVMEKFNYKMGKEDGVYQYYHENGQLWTEKIYDNGLVIEVKGNYSKNGKSRDAGNLKNGNGTVIHYTSEDKVYSIITFKNGLKESEEKF